MKIKKRNRIFEAGVTKIKIRDCGSIKLKNDNQVTFISKNSEYDVCKKNWGYYATPSINGRLKTFGFKTFIVSNSKKKIYIFLVHKNKINLFKNYIKKERNFIIKELTNFKKF
tara:strand:+ start:141 stop:479 length:339 start_codon:yes stop_codon:yes gene_type:complete